MGVRRVVIDSARAGARGDGCARGFFADPLFALLADHGDGQRARAVAGVLGVPFDAPSYKVSASWMKNFVQYQLQSVCA